RRRGGAVEGAPACLPRPGGQRGLAAGVVSATDAGGQYSSFWGRPSVISNHGAFEPTKMCFVGRMLGSSTSDPSATWTYSPSRTTEYRSEPHVAQRVSLSSASPLISNVPSPERSSSFSRSIPANGLNRDPLPARQRG